MKFTNEEAQFLFGALDMYFNQWIIKECAKEYTPAIKEKFVEKYRKIYHNILEKLR